MIEFLCWISILSGLHWNRGCQNHRGFCWWCPQPDDDVDGDVDDDVDDDVYDDVEGDVDDDVYDNRHLDFKMLQDLIESMGPSVITRRFSKV